MKLRDLLSIYSPESWGRGENWQMHSLRLWTEEHIYMQKLLCYMHEMNKWIGGPVTVNDNVIQDGHHRLVVCKQLGWLDRHIPILQI